MPIANELNINTSATAEQMFDAIFGDGVQLVAGTANFYGDAVSSGIYSGALTTIAGVVPTDSGVILSTGNVADFTNSSGTTETNVNVGTTTDTANGIDGDAQLNAVAGMGTLDGAILQADFIPDGDFLTMQFVFTSEEYPEYVNGGVNDAFGVWVNGTFVPVSITVAGNVSIDSVNGGANENLYRDNTGDQFNTEMDGITYVLSFKAPVNSGQVNTIKIGIADGGDAEYDSNLLIMGDSIQTVVLAMDDQVNVVANSNRTFDILGNDSADTGSLTITQINGTNVVAGQTVTLASGQQVRLNADGTVTVFATGTLGEENFSYTVWNGTTTDVGYVTINTVTAATLDGIVSGTSGNDVIDTGYVGDPDGDRIDNNDGTGYAGTTGNADYVMAGAGNDSIVANQGNDLIYAGTGDDTAFGGAGDDWASLGDGNDSFGSFNADSEGNDTIYGEAGNDYIIGGGQNDQLYGGTGNDTLSGGVGSDTLSGGDDADTFLITDDHQGDTIFGGEGGNDNDTLAFGNFASTNGVFVTATGDEAGTYEFFGTASGTTGTYSEIEAVAGTIYDDNLNFGADGSGVTAYGLGGNDIILGSAGSDTIFGNEGDDFVSGGVGNDTVYGGDGNDTQYVGDLGDDLSYGGLGDDVFSGDAGNDTVYGDEGNDALEGHDGSDTIYGGTGDDYIAGFDVSGLGILANRTLTPTIGSDDGANDLLVGGDGNDSILGGAGDDTLTGDLGNDALVGGAGADSLSGGDDADTIYGGAGDTVVGGEGGTDNDTLILNYADVESITYGGGNNEAGTVTFTAASGGGTLSFSEIENIAYAGPVDGTSAGELMGAGYTDVNGDQVDGSDGVNDTILGNDGNDTINAGSGDDLAYGGTGNDVMRAQLGNDTLYGDAGNDDMQSGTGNDVLYGGDGSDLIHTYPTGGADTVVGGETGESGSGDILNMDSGTVASSVTYTDTEAGNISSGTGTVTFSEIETVWTDDGNDTINASAATGDTRVWTSGGDDFITGGSGNDYVAAGLGNDDVFTGVGNDTVYADGGVDQVYGGDGNDQLYGGADNDYMQGDAGNDLVDGGTGDDFLRGDAGNDLVYGGDGNDSVYGGADSDTVFGDAGNDQVFGGFGEDTVYGGAGNDSVTGSGGNDVVYGDDGDDSLQGSDGNDTIYGGAGADTMLGEEDADSFYAASNDYVDGGEAVTTGADNDTLYVTGIDHIDWDLLNPENGTVHYGDGSTVQFYNIERVFVDGAQVFPPDFIVDGTAGGDLIDASYSGDPEGDMIDAADNLAGNNDDVVQAGNGNDTVLSGDGNDSVDGWNGDDSLDGGVGNDSLVGGDGNDTLLGGAGDDSLTGWTGQDLIYGGDGNDVINTWGGVGDVGADTVYAGAGNDGVYGGPGNDIVDLGEGDDNFGTYGSDSWGDDSVIGGLGNDQIIGGTGNDTLYGNEGNDSFGGGLDNDLIYGGDNDDILYGEEGDDLLFGDAGNDLLTGGDGNDMLDGGDGDDTGFGGAGNDTLYGYAGNDSLNGEDGDDTLYGGGGDDYLDGDAGNDVFEGYLGNDTLVGDAGSDTLDGADGDDWLYGGLDDDHLMGGDGNDALFGAEGNDTLWSGEGNDTLYGGAGNDAFSGEGGDDRFTLTDGFGVDTIVGGETGETNGDSLDLASLTGAVTVDLTSSNAEAGTVTAGANSASFTDIENIVLGNATETILLADGSGDDTVQGFTIPTDLGGGVFAGVDQLDVSGLTDAGGNPVNVNDVTVGNDGFGNAVLSFPNGESITLLGVTPASVTDPAVLEAMGIPAETLDFIVEGTAGGDLIDAAYTGDPEGDMIDAADNLAGNNDDLVQAYGGNDVVEAGDGNDAVYGGTGDDSLYGGDGNDALYGEDGDDDLYSGIGDDTIYGGAGNDLIFAAAGADLIEAGAGNDDVRLSGGDTVLGEDGDDLLRADALALDGTAISVTGGETGETLGDTLSSGTYSGGVAVDLTAGGTGADPESGTMQLGTTTITFTEIEVVQTGNGADTITGSSGNDVVLTGGGNDIITGGLGDDSFSGELGDDTLYGGLGEDTLTGGDGNDWLDGGVGNDAVYGGAGNDTLTNGSGNDALYGGDDVDQFNVAMDAGDTTVVGGEGGTDNDTLNLASSTNAVNVIFTGDEAGTVDNGPFTAEVLTFSEIEAFALTSQDDVFDASAATVGTVVDAGAGNDFITGGSGADSITGGAGDDQIVVLDGFGADTITGGETGETFGDVLDASGLTTDAVLDLSVGSNDEDGTLTADGSTLSFAEIEAVILGVGNDSVIGSTGDDVVTTDAGADTVDGGAGNDTFHLGDDGEVDLIRYDDGDGDDTLTGFDAPIDNGDGTFTGGDQLDVSGLTSDGTIPVNTDDVTVTDTNGDGSGDAILTFPDGTSITLVGVTVSQVSSPDQLAAMGIPYAPDLVVDGTTGDDTMGVGFTDIHGDQIDGSDGDNDVIAAGDGNDSVTAGLGEDTVYGGAGDDTVNGMDGEDVIYGEAGNDSLYGWAGNDTVAGGDGNDMVDGDEGDDSLSGGLGTDTLVGDAGNDSLDGGDDADQLYGGTGNDSLTGGDGADTMYGADDRDTFFGGIGDVVDGGEGGDDYDVLDLTAWGHPATNIIYDTMNPENGTVEFLDGSGTVIGTMTFTNIESVVACFTPGSMILTDQGEVAVEELMPGDRVLTRDNGYQVIRWAGRRDLTAAELAVEPRFNPVFIAAGALGAGLPERNMMVSPQHRMLISGPKAELLFGEHEVLVAAKHLVGMAGIEQRVMPQISYIHILFDNHEVVRADGAWSESFQPGAQTMEGMDDAQRAEILSLFPELALDVDCFPVARLSLKAREARVLMGV